MMNTPHLVTVKLKIMVREDLNTESNSAAKTATHEGTTPCLTGDLLAAVARQNTSRPLVPAACVSCCKRTAPGFERNRAVLFHIRVRLLRSHTSKGATPPGIVSVSPIEPYQDLPEKVAVADNFIPLQDRGHGSAGSYVGPTWVS